MKTSVPTEAGLKSELSDLLKELMEIAFGKEQSETIRRALVEKEWNEFVDLFEDVDMGKVIRTLRHNDSMEKVWLISLLPWTRSYRFLELLENKQKEQLLKNLATYQRLPASIRESVEKIISLKSELQPVSRS